MLGLNYRDLSQHIVKQCDLVLQLQAETKIKGMGLEKQANPPLQADAQMKNQPSSSIYCSHIKAITLRA